MIGRIRGQLLEISGNTVLLDVGGVGYEVEVTVGALSQLPQMHKQDLTFITVLIPMLKT